MMKPSKSLGNEDTNDGKWKRTVNVAKSNGAPTCFLHAAFDRSRHSIDQCSIATLKEGIHSMPGKTNRTYAANTDIDNQMSLRDFLKRYPLNCSFRRGGRETKFREEYN
jgi:hypothetical protein